MQIRAMNQSDIAAVRTMFLALYEHLGELGFSYHINADYLSEYLQFQLSSRLSQILVGETAGELVGCIGVAALGVNRKFLSEGGKYYGLISEVYIEDRFRRCGYAAELVKAGEEWLQKVGVNWITVEALMENQAARHLYEMLEFKPYYLSLAKKI